MLNFHIRCTIYLVPRTSAILHHNCVPHTRKIHADFQLLTFTADKQTKERGWLMKFWKRIGSILTAPEPTRGTNRQTLLGWRRLSMPTRSCCNSISFCNISCCTHTTTAFHQPAAQFVTSSSLIDRFKVLRPTWHKNRSSPRCSSQPISWHHNKSKQSKNKIV